MIPDVTALLSQYQYLHISIVLIAGSYNLIAGLQTGEYFVIIRILLAELDINTICGFPILADLEDPVPAGLLVEAAFGYKDSGTFVAQGQRNLEGLALTDTFWHSADKMHIHHEPAGSYLGIDFDDFEFIDRIVGPVDHEGTRLAGIDAICIVFVDI
jgi:hypothetical protein